MLFKKSVNLQGRLVKRCRVLRTHHLLATKAEVQILLLLKVESTLASAVKTSNHWATTKRINSTRLTILTLKVSRHLLNGLLLPCLKMQSPTYQTKSKRNKKKSVMKNHQTQTFLPIQMIKKGKKKKKYGRESLKLHLLYHYLRQLKWRKNKN